MPSPKPSAVHGVVYGFDRVTLWLDRPELPISRRRLRLHCAGLRVAACQPPYQARWKLKVELLQPTHRCLKLLARSIGWDVAVLVNYLEVAADVPANDDSEAVSRRDAVLASAQMRYQHDRAMRCLTTWYYGRRNRGTARCPNVLAIYADKPSKLNCVVRPLKEARPCLHIEWRASGSATLESMGVVSLDDLVQFDHRAFWDKHLRMYLLPKPTALGRLLAELCGADVNVSGTALRKRARRWMMQFTLDEKFVMHNALSGTRQMARHLTAIPFTRWVGRVASE